MLATLQENSTVIRNHSHDLSDTHKMRRDFNKEQLEKITKRVYDQIDQIKVRFYFQTNTVMKLQYIS